MTVIFFQRKPYPHQFSIERVFDGIKKSISEEVKVENAVMPYFSVGFIPRIKNILWSSKHQGNVNHITGDIHYIALALDARKTVLTIHDLNFLNHPNPLARFILKTFWLTLPLRKVTCVTVISEATKKDLLSRVKFPEEKIKVIPNYHNPLFQASPKEFNKGKPRILQIGTKANKNVLRLIEALKEIECHLVIIGGFNELIKKNLEQYKIEYSWLEKLAEAELIEQYQQCDMLSFVSTIEGFGMPILEAQAIGRVVVTSNISSMPEVANNAAHLVDPYDVLSIREGILKVIDDDQYREQLIVNGFENCKRFDISIITKQYLDLYTEIDKE